MEITHLNEFTKGWFIGNFTPSLVQTPFIEVGIVKHKQAEYWPVHKHIASDEVNVLLEGSMTLNKIPLYKNHIFKINKDENSSVEFLTDCSILVIRIPNFKGDKVTL